MSVAVCPKCRTTVQQVGKFFVCPEHATVEPVYVDGPVAGPLRIFLSYGHDGNEELVRRIKADLEQRGHDVWFDKSEIKFGDDWRRSITEGITGSHKFVSFLSKHSTRDPGVCLDEIGIAIGIKEGNIQTILVESEQEVQPPPGVGHTQWLDMHDWKERRDRSLGFQPEERAVADTAWENWYQEKFAEIVRVVESDESRRFAGEIETLKNHLKPIKSDSRIYELLKKGFTGRRWLFEAVENWRKNDRDSRVFWLMGAPGVGKSAVAAHLAIHGREVIAVEFCNWQQPGHKNPEQIVRTLAFQIATRLPDYRKLLLTLPQVAELGGMNGDELFDYLLANPLKLCIKGGRERYLIVIDALDEAGEAGHNPLVEMLARHAPRLPDWIGLVVTSRPESNVIAPLQALNPFPFETSSEKNLADIRDYLRHELASKLQGRADADRLVGQILEKSEGVFLYVERFCDDIRRGHLSLDHPEQFPQGLGGIFFQYFQRQFPDLEKFRKDVRPALRAILAAREPLPVEILQRLFNWQDEELRDFTHTLGSLFPVAKEANGETIKPYHKSLADWLADESKAMTYFVSVREGNRMLAQFCWQEYKADFHRASLYTKYHARSHFMEEPSVASELLDQAQMTSLLQNEDSISPLVLFAALSSLHWCSSFEQRNQRIAQLPCTTSAVPLPISPTPIFRQVVKWLADDFAAATVKELLTNLACSRNGLSEHELLQLVDGERLEVLRILNKLRPFLQTRDSLIFFFHHSFYRAVCEEYLEARYGLGIATHRKLLKYFSTREPDARSLCEVEWQQARLTK